MGEPKEYGSFKSLAEFGLSAEGGAADHHLIPAKDLEDLISAVASITRRTMLLCMGRPSPGPADIGQVNVMLTPPAKGSFLMGIAVGVGTNVVANLVTPHVEDALHQVWQAALGKLERPTDERVEPWFENVVAVADDLHPSFQKLAGPVSGSVGVVSLFAAGGNAKTPIARIDAQAKEELSKESTSEIVERFTGRVRQLNDRTRRGIIDAKSASRKYDGERGETLRFWIDNEREEERIVAALAQNLAMNNDPRGLLRGVGVGVLGRRVTTISGRTKRILIGALTK